jgi:hypothetical protein
MDLFELGVFIAMYRFWIGLIGGLLLGTCIGFIIAGVLSLEPPEPGES